MSFGLDRTLCLPCGYCGAAVTSRISRDFQHFGVSEHSKAAKSLQVIASEYVASTKISENN